MTTNNRLTDEFLEKLATSRVYPLDRGYIIIGDDLVAMARELQERRKADSAEPIYQWRERYEEGSLWDDCTKAQHDGFAEKTDCEVRILYTAPPAPVVPQEATPDNIEILASTDAPFGATYQWDGYGCTVATIAWNACRAAMLQAGNSPVTPDGWIPVSERMPEAHEPIYIFHPDYGVDEGVWYDNQEDAFLWDSDCSRCRAIETVSHWMPMPAMPAAPQQEYL